MRSFLTSWLIMTIAAAVMVAVTPGMTPVGEPPILGIAAFRSDRAVVPYGLALAFGGGLVAFYHSLLYVGVIPAPIVPCTGGPSCSGESMAIGGVPLPLPSLTAFALILTLLLNFQRRLKS